MRLRALLSILFLTVLAALLVPAAQLGGLAQSGQQGRPPVKTEQNPPTIRVQVSLVNIFATVRDGKKRIIPDLTQDDFKIFEEGQQQKIAAFSRETALPITLGMLIDTSGSEMAMLGAEQQAASRFLDRVLRKSDEAMVISFDTDVDLLADWTSDRDTLERGIRKARINAAGAGGPVTPGPIPTRGPKGTNFYDAVYLACNEKLASEAGRKALVILTDAMDNGSKMRVEDAIQAAQRTDTVVHILLIGDPREGMNEGVAKKLTDETGGRTIVVHSEKKLEEAFQEISEELRTQYVLGYYSTNTARDGRYRKIKVETTGKDQKVLTRKGYYAAKD
jgi:VWFA-related protein